MRPSSSATARAPSQLSQKQILLPRLRDQDDSPEGAALAQAERGSALRIPPFHREVGHHRLQHLGEYGRGGVMVQVDH